MFKASLKLSSILFLTLASVAQVNATTYKAGNDNFTLIYNENKEVASTFLSLNYLNSNPSMDSFSIIARTNSDNQKGVQLIGDIKTNTITAYTYNSGNSIGIGEIKNNTIFDDGIIVNPNAPWNTLTTGMDITDGWKVTHGEVNLMDVEKSIPYGYDIGKVAGKNIDIDGESAGTISKTLATEIGETYTLTFEHIASPYVDNEFNANWKEDKQFQLKIDDVEVDFSSEFDDKKWKTETVTFTATSELTDISFISASIGEDGHVRTGAYLDDIRISKNTTNQERLGTIYGAITATGFTVDLEEINALSVIKGGEKFEINDAANIQFTAGNNSDIVYNGQDIVRYNTTLTDIGTLKTDTTTTITMNTSNAVSEPSALLLTLTAIGLFFARPRRQSKMVSL
jgi:hypothetical protein